MRRNSRAGRASARVEASSVCYAVLRFSRVLRCSCPARSPVAAATTPEAVVRAFYNRGTAKSVWRRVSVASAPTSCVPPNLVVIWGPDDSVICAYPNNLVAPGNYKRDPATLTMVSK